MTWSTQLETCVTPRLPTLGRKFRKIVLTCAERVSSDGPQRADEPRHLRQLDRELEEAPRHRAPGGPHGDAVAPAPVFAPARTRAAMIAPFQRTGAA